MKKTFYLIHIGKTAGTTVRYCLRESPVLKQFDELKEIHVGSGGGHKYNDPNGTYLFTARNPVSRSVSGFYHAVYDYRNGFWNKSKEKPKFDKLFRNYKDINDIAEDLYNEDQINQKAADLFNNIEHTRKNIAFYLNKETFYKLQSKQILGITCQETINEDVKKYLNVDNTHHLWPSKKQVPDANKKLSELGHKNLVKYFSKDYEMLEILLEKFPLDDKRTNILLNKDYTTWKRSS